MNSIPQQKKSDPTDLDLAQRDLNTAPRLQTEVSALLIQAAKALEKRCINTSTNSDSKLVLHIGLNVDQFCKFLTAQGVSVKNGSGDDVQINDAVPGILSAKSSWGTAVLTINSEADLVNAINAVESFCKSYLIGFDLDGTLVDTVESFDTTVKELVSRHSGRSLEDDELKSLRAEGGFNNNWDAAVELISRRGKRLTRQELDPEALEIYFSLAANKESLLVNLETLELLARRHPLFILTGRCQFEYQPVWAGRLGDNFQKVYCLDDLPHCKPKPAGDSLVEILKMHNATTGVYVGNALDDMWAARAADMHAVAVTTTHNAEELRNAGAQQTYASPDQVLEAFLI